ncbi:unnamed protein product [Clavelina lepadiformis]|uniref:Receptor protein-tyrosine kinase n=2 Tax=Clavelina lepadiformis TaxID=159417 RepID=A0ABP0F2E8_CLALP
MIRLCCFFYMSILLATEIHTQFIPRRSTRLCESLEHVEIVGFHSYPNVTVEDINGDLDVKLTTTVIWNFTIPEGIELDGIIIHFQESTTTHSEPSYVPLYICNTGSNYYWVNTTDNTTLCTKNTNEICGSPHYTSNDFSLCLYNYTSHGGPPNCRGTGNYFLNERKGLSILPDVRQLTFAVDFHKTYSIDIIPYYREFTSRQINVINSVFAIDDCQSIIMNYEGKSFAEATETCCEMGVRHHLPRNVTFSNISVDLVTLSVNVTARWLPPITQNGLMGFDVFPFGDFLGKSTEPISFLLSPEETAKLASCDNTTEYYEAVLFGLIAGTTYNVQITSEYLGELDKEFGCSFGQCRKTTVFPVPEIDICESNYSYCDVNADCIPFQLDSLNATCNCREGYEGNGVVNPQIILGNGCQDINNCSSELSPCHPSAVCTDLAAPLIGANCSCMSGFYGDGLKEGSGCQSSSTIALAVSIPIVIVLAIIVAYTTWRVWRCREQEKDLQWEAFVASKGLINYQAMGDGIANTPGSEICAPTFGEKWELDRDQIKIGNILGRGNYGVVYEAMYHQHNESMQEVPVAVKMVKEGSDEDKHIAEFLAEISFMLNVGDHPNVLKVIGCCTTQKPVILVTDLLKYGDLLHFLWDAREPSKCLVDPIYHITEKTLYQMARQIACGMDYLTKTRIIHGDIAARNILVGEDLICKISDFGLANDVYRYGVIQGQSERCVPFKWISPERMMAGKVPITSKSDVWSFGNLMYEMVTLGCMPYSNLSSDELLDKLRSGYRMKQPSTCSNEMFSIMAKCWAWRPSSRPSFSNLVSMIDKVLGQIKDADYVNLAETVEELDKLEYETDIHTQKEKATDHKTEETSDLPEGHINPGFIEKNGHINALNGDLSNGCSPDIIAENAV